MADDEFHIHENHYEERSGGQMLKEIGRLLLVLLGKLMRKLWKYTKKFLRWLLKWICKGLLWLIDATEKGFYRLRRFWNDKNTQEKLRTAKEVLIFWLRKLGKWILQGIKTAGKGIKWFVIHLGIWTVSLSKKTIQGIIHLRPTFRKIGRGLILTAKAIGRWFCRLGKSIKNWWIRRRIAYRKFRQNKGFKGLLIDIGNSLKRSVNNFMDEEQDEPSIITDETSAISKDAQTSLRSGGEDDNVSKEVSDDYELQQINLNSVSINSDNEKKSSTEFDLSLELSDSALSNQSRLRKWGKRIYDGMRKITEA